MPFFKLRTEEAFNKENLINLIKESTEKELRQLFRNNSNCYANVKDDSNIPAIDENCFIQILNDYIQKNNMEIIKNTVKKNSNLMNPL